MLLYGAPAAWRWLCGRRASCSGPVLTYTILPGLMEEEEKPDAGEGLNGVWLLIVVGHPVGGVLGVPAGRPHLPDAAASRCCSSALCFWLVGGMLYIWLIALIFYRIMFLPAHRGRPDAAVLDQHGGDGHLHARPACRLVASRPRVRLLAELLPFLKGLTLLFWATATWWMPLLLMLGAWRHVVKAVPADLRPRLLGGGLPARHVHRLHLSHLARSSTCRSWTRSRPVFVWVALAAWAATFGGLVVETWPVDQQQPGETCRQSLTTK